MERTFINELRGKLDQTVKLQGWLQTLRDQKKIQFLILRDPTGLVQVAHWKPNDEALAEKIAAMGVETALTITGKVIDNPVVKLNQLELQLESLQIENEAEIPLPFDPFADTLPALDYRLDWRYMDLRRPYNTLLFQVETTIEMAMREYWIKHAFIEVHSPKLMGTPSESGAELFSLDYFERKAYLAQSPQFYKQMLVGNFFRIFHILFMKKIIKSHISFRFIP